MQKLSIGITFRDDQSLHQTWWGSGIGQNIKFYYDLFELMGHEPYMILNQHPPEFRFGEKRYRTRTYDEILNHGARCDLYLEAGSSIQVPLKQQLREQHASRFVGLRCGHQYFIAAEGLFVAKNLPAGLMVGGQDRVWILPHYARQSAFLATLHHCPVDVVPYIWEPHFVERDFHRTPRPEPADIYILEPNISVAKNALIPMAILQRVFERAPDSFGKAFIGNSRDFFQDQGFLQNFVVNLPVLRAEANKAFFVGRAPINQIFQRPDVLLCCQFDNQLNNIYKEAIHMGLPLVHNSPAYADLGYYYDDFDVDQGADRLLEALSDHNPPTEAESQKAHVFLSGYSIHNARVQSDYEKLLALAMD